MRLLTTAPPKVISRSGFRSFSFAPAPVGEPGFTPSIARSMQVMKAGSSRLLVASVCTVTCGSEASRFNCAFSPSLHTPCPASTITLRQAPSCPINHRA